MIMLARDKFMLISGFAYYHSFQIIQTVSEANPASYSVATTIFYQG